MALPGGLSAAEIAIFLNCRINTIEAVLCAVIPNFDMDLEQQAHEEIDAANGIDAASKTKLKNYITAIRTKHRVNRSV